MVKQQGAFIVIEGGEGAGKTSVLAFLKQKLPHALFTREPGGTPYAEDIRTLALSSEHAKHADGLTQLLLMFAARRDHLVQCIIPARAQGTLVICDRFVASSWAYNVCGQEQHRLAPLFEYLEEHTLEACTPDRYIYLKVPVEIGLARRSHDIAGGQNHFDKRKLDFHQRVHAGYEEYLARVPHVVVDATQPLHDVCEEVSQALAPFVSW